jgi:membrane protein implicated in regulation of membrane protease activity
MHPLLDLFATHAFWAWMAAAALLLTIEIGTGTGYLLWPAASAGVIGFVTLVSPPDPPIDALAFAILTILSTIIGRRYFPHPFRRDGPDINDRAGRLIGRTGEIVQPFAAGIGRAFVDGTEWAAEMADGAAPVAVGSRVEVVEVLGAARLKVKPAG